MAGANIVFIDMLLVAFLAILFFLLLVAAIMYVFESIAMFTIAKRRKIKYYGLAWVPVANAWLYGCVADQYDYITTGKRKNARTLLLVLGIAMLVIAAIVMAFALTAGIKADTSYAFNEYNMFSDYYGYNNYSAGGDIIAVAGILLFSFIMMAVSVVYIVFFYISLYKIYKSCSPGNAVVFLVLSIFFSVTLPFFLFAVRNKDLGVVNTAQAGSLPQPNVQTANGVSVQSNQMSAEDSFAAQSADSQPPVNEPKSADYNPYARQTQDTVQQGNFENPYSTQDMNTSSDETQSAPSDEPDNN